MKKKLIALLLVFTIILPFAACSKKTNSSQTSQTASSSVSIQMPEKDRAGNSIDVPKNIDSIISLAPSITQTLVALGLGDKIVAIDTNSATVEGIKKDLPAFDIMKPDAEKLVNMKPSIIFATDISLINGKDAFKTMKDLGICIASIPTSNSIQGIRDDITFISQVTQTADKGKKLIENMDKEIEKIENIGKTITDKKKVYFEIAAAPEIYSFGKDVFLNEMINIIGAENVFADKKGWIAAEPEIVVNLNPDVILTNVNYIENPTKEILSRSGWENMKAVKDKQVYYIDNIASSIPNHNIVKALKEMAKAVYPDKYKDE